MYGPSLALRTAPRAALAAAVVAFVPAAGGCAAVAVTGAVVGTAASVAGTAVSTTASVVGTTVKATGKAVGATVDVLTPSAPAATPPAPR